MLGTACQNQNNKQENTAKNFIYFIPSYANMLIKMNIQTLEMKKTFIADEEEDQESIKRRGRVHIPKYEMIKQKNNLLMLLSVKNKNLIFIDLDTEKVKKVEFKMQYKDGINIFDKKIYLKFKNEQDMDFHCHRNYYSKRPSRFL